MKIPITALSCLLLMVGCGDRRFTPRAINPVTEDYISARGNNNYSVISTRPDRRSVFINLLPGQNYADICAEPPADAAEAFASSQSLQLSRTPAAAAPATATSNASQAAASAALNSSLSTAVGALLARSQGLQWQRDQMFYLCIEKMNGTISAAEYLQLRLEVMRTSAALIQNEVAQQGSITVPNIIIPSPTITTTQLPRATSGG